MTISNEAIEKAAQALWQVHPLTRENVHAATRRALEAAAPLIAAQALEDAAEDFEGNIGVTEFDDLARRDGRRWTHIDDAWEYQGPYMDWLRARAVTVRGGE